ncbi:MAG: type I restriction enzyme HsdR N-terminal domain-containing protein [Planctomycetes bacterium]|nr:type I restriction enzyme HsdR N-terminal domain-containing protein [Planctomycetota bacterium]
MAKKRSNASSREQDRQRAVIEARGVIQRLAKMDGNEAETRRRVERIFESVLGYHPFEHLTREHAIRGAGETEHVDFAIRIDAQEHSRPTILVELKRVGTDLARKHLKQVSSYAINTGCEWIILTNGRQWRLYHVAFGQPPVTKRLFEWDLLEDDVEMLAKRFELISYRSVKKGVLDKLWQKREVLDSGTVLQAIFSESSMKALWRQLRRSTGVPVSIDDVIDAVHHLLNDNALATMGEITSTAPEHRTQRRESTKQRPGTRAQPAVTLLQLIKAGILPAPLPLFREYKGRRLEAALHPDGTIEFKGTQYDSPSTAAAEARSVILGRHASTNGWRFWRFVGRSGDERSLDDARDEYHQRRKQQGR